MKFFMLGGIVFVFFDYVLMFGKLGFPALQLQGSAIASVIQYAVMLCAIIAYVVIDPKCRQYSFHAFKSFDRHLVRDIWRLSWPVVIDKTSLTFAKLWLVRLIAPMGKMVIAGFTVISDMEQFAFVPALALAQVITFLVSNDYGIKNWMAIKNNTKKVMFLASIIVLSIVVFFSLVPGIIIGLVDKKNIFTRFATLAFPLLSTVVIFDVFQIILAGALRGASNVKTVMATRVMVTLFMFVPISFFASIAPIANPVIKFVLIFGSYYISNGVMSIVFVYRFRREAWKQHGVASVKHKHDLVQPALPTQTEDIYEKNTINVPGDQLPGKDVPHQDQPR
jgi:Na+-driven multidrug efflux pump